jgi:DNA-binding CsgD family transcriptional regulator
MFGWATANVRFEVLNTARSAACQAVPAGDLAAQLWSDPAPGTEEQAERRAAAREAEQQMRQLLPQLSRRERQVILASGFGTRSNVETGTRLGISRAAASVAKQNAIARMRELLGVTPPGGRAERRAVAYCARVQRRTMAAGAAAGRVERAGPRGGPLPAVVHEAGRAAAAAGWPRERLIREFGVSNSTVSRWQAAARNPDAGGRTGPAQAGVA